MPTPLINGTNYSWSNISVNPFGTPLTGIVSIDYDMEQQKDDNYGAGVDPVSRGYGQNKYTASMEVYLDEWKAFIAAAPQRNPLLIPPFDIPVTFQGDGVLTERDVLRACEFKNNPMNAKAGDTKIIVKINLAIAGITR